ncbi:esterase/lipase family protein [Wenzhouxiangella marina]|uniref:Uncharacterized protein n=1 Tax=Wenzhouxiangella marina TaxID=1579979 RepID=A0A0K0XVG6_9GAMM|nr:alpha/beta fold hydrolase [Wenzhouxiangella marina]AKS41611.1 hypothetical protein WM2015_1237 [Wenzhouxiangella marina]MBB6086630.1 pimeloyl-ACP methyl ester carboxylesterase [Wenzhouxiangella marina]
MTTLAPPPRKLLWKEARVASDAVHMALRWLQPGARRIETEPVLLLPGFGASEAFMRPLKRQLARHGIHAEDWGLGRNLAGLDIRHRLDDVSEGWQLEPLPRYRGEAGVPLLCDRLIARAQQRAAALDSKLTLIGWSLGGTIAREAARECPELISQVITLGSPVLGGPKYTAAADRLAGRGLDLDWIERQVERRSQTPIQVPVTAIVSRSDAIVGYQAALDEANPRVRHVELDVSHLGMAINPKVWDVILATLSKRA